MKIERLSDHPEVIPQLADWYLSEWDAYYGAAGPGDARADLQSRCNSRVLPVGLVAFKGGQAVATAAIGLDAATGLTPSIIGLLVEPGHRRRAIATALVDACEDVARELGHKRLHVSTNVIGPLLERTGWQKMGKVTFRNDERGSVYRRDL